MNGVINVYKEKGFTSHDVVAKLRGILKERRIGHTGTLDPEAEGVLPVCIGTATKLCDMLTDKSKVYRAEIMFGVATDTEDMTGTIIKELPVTSTAEELPPVLESFLGTTLQIPPMYSAIKVEGKKLYELAREGKTVERKAREITIHAIELKRISTNEDGTLSEAVIEVTCGKGTYIRSLCRDIGERLGTCACMKSLLRLRSGEFCIEQSMRLSEIEEAVKNHTIEKSLISVESIFASCGRLLMKPEWDKLLHNGNRLPEQTCEVSGDRTRVRAYDSVGSFCGIYEFEEKTQDYAPVKMFLER
ncbi:MAG: tRNA pseudouridine(55) synthase TruB [Lachnospiraceae bacterium]